MTDRLRLDGRRETALREEMLRRAAATLSGDGQERPPGEVASALIGVAARIGEEVTRRLDRVPAKQADNLFSAMGIGRDPARPARVPVAFRLADPAPDGLVAPAGTRLMAPGEAGAVAFETRSAIALAPGAIVALVAVDAEKDQIFLPPASVVRPTLPREPVVERALTSGGGPGADKLQISLAAGLAPGTILSVGAGGGAAEHRVVEIDNDLVAIDPPLDRTFGSGAPVTVTAEFTTFAGHRDRQAHALYLGHETLLNLPSALSIVVTGLNLPEDTEWSWWGGDDPPRWHRLGASIEGSRLVLAKGEGQPAKTVLRGRESYWLRARLRGSSGGPSEARDIRLSVGGSSGSAEASGIEAIANMTPLVLNSAFHPFGREPRLYDSFYIGCAEAFSKPGAAIALAFSFAGPQLGPLATVSLEGLTQIFGVAKDGLLYRAQLGKGQPQLVPIVPSREDMGGIAVEPQAPVAARRVGMTAFVAIGAKGAVHLARIPIDGPLEAGSLKWKPLLNVAGRDEMIAQLAFVEHGTSHKLLAQTEQGSLLAWTWPSPEADPELSPKPEPDGALVPIQGVDAALIVEPADASGRRRIRFEGLSLVTPDAIDKLPEEGLAAWAYVAPEAPAGSAPKPDAPATIVYLAGTDPDRSKLQIVQLGGESRKAIPEILGKFGRIAFEPPPRGAAPDGPPTLLVADPEPRRFVFRGPDYRLVGKPPRIEATDNPGRHFVLSPAWVAVPAAGPGLLHRPARDGRWADEYDLVVIRADLALAGGIAGDAEFATWQRDPKGGRLDLARSASSERRLLIPALAPPEVNEANVKAGTPRKASFFRMAGREPGTVTVDAGGRISLADDRASQALEQAKAQLAERVGSHGSAKSEHEARQREEKAALALVAAAEDKHEEAKRKWSALVAEAASLRSSAQAAQDAYEAARSSGAAGQAALDTARATAAVGAAGGADPIKAAQGDLKLKQEDEAAKKTFFETADSKAAEAEARAAVANASEAQAKATAATLAAEAATLRSTAEAAKGQVRLVPAEESARKTEWEAADRAAAEAEARAAVANAAALQAAAASAPLLAEATQLRSAARSAQSALEAATALRAAAEARLAAAQAVRSAELELERLKSDEANKKSAWDDALRKADEAAAGATNASGQVGQQASEVTRLKAEHRAAVDRLNEAAGKLLEAKARESDARLALDSVGETQLRVEGLEADILLFENGSSPRHGGIWHLSRTKVTDKEWRSAADLPRSAADKAMQYQLLSFLGEFPVDQAVEVARADDLRSKLAEVASLRSDEDPDVAVTAAMVERFDEKSVIPFPVRLLQPAAGEPNRRALLTTGTDDWSFLGPAQPPNPGLSWEYWNGDSWWALDGTRLVDRTSNLLLDGTVSFTVPADLRETEVGGRENHWIRARLVGGDYGEAQVAVRTVPAAGGESRQIVERDMSTIRAPYVTSLKLGFCARDEVPPQFILTEDSLGTVDQAAANLAGLPVKLFAPVRDLMGAGAVSRAVMIGLSKPVRGDPVSLYVDAVPGGGGGLLMAEVLRDGRFERVPVMDETRGLSEPGMILLALQTPPDPAELFGTAAHWLRLRPTGAANSWLPRIRAIHLNAAYADSVETRELEILGHSSGIPDQFFHLAGPPVDAGSLELRIAESLGEEDRLSGGLDVVEVAGSKPGCWVRWAAVEDFSTANGRTRSFLLDPQTGLVRFGDGRRGAIPPLGAELLAVNYRSVSGEAGNLVAPGAALQIISPVASVERVTALDAAAGGSDAETIEQARRRGTAKLRHGNRVITLADLEDFVRACSPAVAQARAANRGGRVRLVVAATGAEPRPGPAMLRALRRSLQSAAAYGVARYGGVDIAAPRLLPLRVKLTLEPDDPEMYVEMAQAAEAHLGKLFDAATGGFDGQGWPIGRAPTPGDIAAALEPVSRFGVASVEALERADRRGAEAFPAAIPDDVLVRFEADDLVCERRREKAA